MKNILSDIKPVPSYLRDTGFDFKGLNVPTAAVYYYRVALWLNAEKHGSNVLPFTVAQLAAMYHTIIGCGERAKTADGDDKKIWDSTKTAYEKLLKSQWRLILRSVNGYGHSSGSSKTNMRNVLEDDSRDAEITAFLTREFLPQ